MAHANEVLLRDLYDAFGRGDLATVLGYLDDAIQLHVPGNSLVSGTYNKAEFGPVMIGKVMELSAGSFRETPVALLADDAYGVALLTHHVQRDGVEHEYNTSHVWRFENGKVVEWWEYPRDLHEFERVWS